MKPFVKAELPKTTAAELKAKFGHITASMTEQDWEREANRINNDPVYLNDVYQVQVTEGEEVIHLSIKRLDKGAGHSWRDFQQIKNELLGPEYEAVELYPAESRLVDSANQYHLWAIKDQSFRFPFGFGERLVTDGDGQVRPDGSRQEPFKKEG